MNNSNREELINGVFDFDIFGDHDLLGARHGLVLHRGELLDRERLAGRHVHQQRVLDQVQVVAQAVLDNVLDLFMGTTSVIVVRTRHVARRFWTMSLTCLMGNKNHNSSQNKTRRKAILVNVLDLFNGE